MYVIAIIAIYSKHRIISLMIINHCITCTIIVILLISSNTVIVLYQVHDILIATNTNSDESGIAYLIGRNESQSTFASVPKNDEGVIVEDNQSVFDFYTHGDEIESKVGYCGSAQFQAAYKLAINWMEQYFAMNAEKDCLLYTSPSPRDVEESRMPSSA